MPIVEFSNFTPDKKPPLYECFDPATGQILSSCELGYPSCYGIPGLEVHLGRSFKDIQKEIPKVVSEKEFDQYDDSTFHFVPDDSHVMRIVASEALQKGEQMPYHYGWCSNRFFLVNYGFGIPNNPMDAITIRMKADLADPESEKLILLHREGKQKKYLATVKSYLETSLGLTNVTKPLILTFALGQLQQSLASDFGSTTSTTLDQDRSNLETGQYSSARVRQALEYRIQMKEIYHYHINKVITKLRKCSSGVEAMTYWA